MVARIFFEFVLPGVLACYFAWKAAGYWYLKWFPKGIQEHLKRRKATQDYEKDLNG